MDRYDGLAIAGILVLVVALYALWVWVVQWAWNAFVPAVFGGPSIDLLQAAALAIFIAAISGGTRYVKDR